MTSRLEKKIGDCMERKEFYEAHQVYRTLYYRMSSAKKYVDLMTLLFNGSMDLYKVGELQSATDLSDLFVDTLIKSGSPPSDIIYDRLVRLLTEMYTLNKEKEESLAKADLGSGARNKFVSDAIKWSQSHATKNREKKRGLSDLHLKFGTVFWEGRDFEAARAHMLVAENPEKFADFLIDMHQKLGDASEADLFISLAVLQLLCLHRVNTAGKLLMFYVERHPAMKFTQAPYPLPLVNFLWLLILAIPSKNLSHFSTLVEKYQPSLSRDCNNKAYLDKIGQLFFKLPAPQSNGGGLFGNLFKGLLGGDKKEEEEPFSDSDVDWADNEVEMEDGDEEGYMTADDETKPTVPSSSGAQKRAVMEDMDDLD